ncbi:UNVERIFIED_CONTAM: hypothetical protein HHA_449400 [Hammondia hammondi]|eukprot:XP_008882075.1 hypothetical protein HHA_449400 [Hammondia hammondi]
MRSSLSSQSTYCGAGGTAPAEPAEVKIRVALDTKTHRIEAPVSAGPLKTALPGRLREDPEPFCHLHPFFSCQKIETLEI